jgi:hypothetical protein
MGYVRTIVKYVVAEQGGYTINPDGSVNIIIKVEDGNEETMLDQIILGTNNDHLVYA